jgi:CRP/FNR family cyclic AMP-dependent transcriptional regulator
MPIEGKDVITPGASRWPARSTRVRALESEQLYAYLLDADDDLAQELDVRMRFAARQLTTARVLDAELGECDLSSWLSRVGAGPGLLILDGLVAADTRIADRTVTELLGAGDLVQPVCRQAEEMIQEAASWRALSPTRFALLDTEFAERARPWPAIGQALLRRAGRRVSDNCMVRAISCQPRLELRLVLILWHLAARWGRVEPTGLRLSLPLTHRLLGQLIAAERPSVSHALGRLTRAELISGTTDDLHLHGTVEAHLQSLLEQTTSMSRGHRLHRSVASQNRLGV